MEKEQAKGNDVETERTPKTHSVQVEETDESQKQDELEEEEEEEEESESDLSPYSLFLRQQQQQQVNQSDEAQTTTTTTTNTTETALTPLGSTKVSPPPPRTKVPPTTELRSADQPISSPTKHSFLQPTAPAHRLNHKNPDTRQPPQDRAQKETPSGSTRASTLTTSANEGVGTSPFKQLNIPQDFLDQAKEILALYKQELNQQKAIRDRKIAKARDRFYAEVYVAFYCVCSIIHSTSCRIRSESSP